MPLGDSITEGNGDYNSYRRPLWKMLGEAGYRVDFVGSSSKNYWGGPEAKDFDPDHEGHWAWSTDEVLAHLDRWLERNVPDVVLLHLGSNDLFRGDEHAHTVNELLAVVRTLRQFNPRVVILVAQIIPSSSTARETEKLNLEIARMASWSTADSPIHVVDQFTGFDPVADTWDGIHPSETGEQKMAQRWFAALRVVLPQPAP